MSYLVLARKWRPKVFSELVGQDHVVKALTHALDHQRLHHAYLFSGTRGVGKTTVARILAKALNCEQGVSSEPCGKCQSCIEVDEGRFLDLIEVDAASRTKVEDTRDLLDNVQYAPTRGKFKVYLIDEVHMLSTHSFNALLKTLEEPPPHVKFLLATTDPQKLPVTVLSRCLQFNLKALAAERLAAYLMELLQVEGVTYEEVALHNIADAANGSVRDALSLVDQAIAHGGGKLTAVEVNAMLGDLGEDQVIQLILALCENDGAKVLDIVQQAALLAVDFDGLLCKLLQGLKNMAVLQTVPEALSEHQKAQLEKPSSLAHPEQIQLFYQIGINGRRELGLAHDPRSGFEMLMLRMLAFQPASLIATEKTIQPVSNTYIAKPAQTISNKVSEPEPVAEQIMHKNVEDGNWQQMVESLPISGIPKQLAANCVLVAKENDVYHLQLSPNLQQLAAKGVQDRLLKAMSSMLGKDIKINIEFKQPETESPAAAEERKQNERQEAAERQIKTDPTVNELIETFDGKILPDSIQPK